MDLIKKNYKTMYKHYQNKFFYEIWSTNYNIFKITIVLYPNVVMKWLRVGKALALGTSFYHNCNIKIIT